MNSPTSSLGDEPARSLREIWEAARDRAAGDRSRTTSACIDEQRGRHGATWVKERYAVFEKFLDQGVKEIAPSEGYLPSEVHRMEGTYAPFEVRRWLGSYSKRIRDDDLRSLLTWHLRWLNQPIEQVGLAPPSTAHLAGLLNARTRVTNALEVHEPTRIVWQYLGEVGKPAPVEEAAERDGPDPALDQLRSHVPDQQLWDALETERKAIDAYESGVLGSIRTFEAEAVALTAMSRAYGYGQSSVEPSSPPAVFSGFLGSLFEHVFALLSGQAPTGYRTRVEPFSPQHPQAFKLWGGWDNLSEAAMGDRVAIERAEGALHELDERMLKSPVLRHVWRDFETARDGKRALDARFRELDEARISLGRCWGC
jgi:hypothetical protein